MKYLLIKVFCIGIIVLNIAEYAYSQEQKYALIIGVKSYKYVQPLQNSLNDARDMSATLKGKGFQVIELYDPKTKREMQDAIRKYFSLLQGKPNAAGLVFYSGHGMQVKGMNYLIPTMADPQLEADLDDQCVNMDYVMRAIEEAGNGLNIFVLDACRNNPFRSFSRSGEKGLSMVNTPKGSYIVYATKPGSVASDGVGRNGLFTSKLLKYINEEGLNIEQVFKSVARDVAIESNDSQRPWIASDYTGDFFFTPGERETSLVAIESPAVNEPIAKKDEVKTNGSLRAVGFDYGYGTADAPVVVVGNQTWLGKNLNVDHFANGDPIPEAKTPKEWKEAGEKKQPAWCYYENSVANGSTYGKLYNWYAVNDPRGLAPKGWHIPSDEEWSALVDFLGGDVSAGLAMKSTSGWATNGNGNNNSQFAGLPGGSRNPAGFFFYLGKNGNWWSSTDLNETMSWLRSLYHANARGHRNFYDKKNGYSVRCIRD